MRESNAQCITNCFNSLKGTHILYRNFGLNETDKTKPPLKRDIIIQLSTYYPYVSLQSISLSSANIKGEFYYNIEIKG
jgi:hypothetical protein